MRRLRRTVIRALRLVGPCSVLAAAVFIAGLGLHAARDWHRHGEVGAGFFHLHFHVGDHEHEEHRHRHSDEGENDHDTSDDEQRTRTAVLTVAYALYDLVSEAPKVVDSESSVDRRSFGCVSSPRTLEVQHSAIPRAPPA